MVLQACILPVILGLKDVCESRILLDMNAKKDPEFLIMRDSQICKIPLVKAEFSFDVKYKVGRDTGHPMVYGFGGLRPTALELWAGNGHIPPGEIEWSSRAITGVFDPLNPQCTGYWGLCPPNTP